MMAEGSITPGQNLHADDDQLQRSAWDQHNRRRRRHAKRSTPSKSRARPAVAVLDCGASPRSSP